MQPLGSVRLPVLTALYGPEGGEALNQTLRLGLTKWSTRSCAVSTIEASRSSVGMRDFAGDEMQRLHLKVRNLPVAIRKCGCQAYAQWLFHYWRRPAFLSAFF